MPHIAISILLTLLLFALPAKSQQSPSQQSQAKPVQTLVIYAGTLLAEPPLPPVKRKTIIVRGDKIAEVHDDFVDPSKFAEPGQPLPRLIDLSSHFVVPGLIDGHTHLSFQSGVNPIVAYRQSDSEQALTAMIFARRTLAAGFTTVRDLASGRELMYAVRNAINAGRYIGPRIYAAGLPITARGGHGDFPGLREDVWSDKAERESGVCWDEGSCRDAVRLQIKRGSDVIKLMASGGFASGTGPLQQLTFPEMKAAIDAAHMRNVKVTTHAYATSAIADAVRAGVDSVEHGIGLDEDTAREMAKRGTFFIPTLMVYNPPPPNAGQTPVPQNPMARSSQSMSNRAMKIAIKHKVKIAFGTDAGVGSPHGSNAYEFKLLVDAGLTPLQAIATATTTAAESLGITDQAGRITAGASADLVAVTADPLSDVTALQTVDFVMKSGRVAKQNGQMLPAERWDDPYLYP
jgi:imidazolonepropionase-like amidohydrolase